ncbi:peptidylprolyl isomerase [Microcoleus sp. LEGE 07076]|uniref:peptidylprolyl isomerase n=1 Tax=Microcoleus sp. LEGE 07076 TaxID=915322 RepID=UPI001881924E|nr:peptidylprolyl isomerase [Microcoleus sp. LEGE 07076]MBE9187380.1 peptidylprolyl isomerase [Microcoleus sp. LEGE 07076]
MKDFSQPLIEASEIIELLRQELQLKPFCQKLLQKKVIDKAARERGLSVTPEEIQTEGDKLRREKRLEKAADTIAWLAEQMISVEDLEAGICERILSQKLAEHLFAKDVEKIFVQSKLQFDQIILYQIIVANIQLAQEIFYQIQEGEISFFDAAHFYDIDEHRRHLCGCEGKVYRWSLKPDIAVAVFSAQPGEVIRPIETERGYHLCMVEKFLPAELTPERYQEILHNLFNEWLGSEVNHLLYTSKV